MMNDVSGNYIPPTEEDGNADHEIEANVTISAVWLRRIGDKVQVLVKGQRGWLVAIEGYFDEPFSRIAESNAVDQWPLDPLTKEARRD